MPWSKKMRHSIIVVWYKLMGNNLCASWQKGYRDGLRWPPAKDTHLIRLWAEIFEVREENNEVVWGRISEDVVPVNVVCVRNSPETVLQITAYNRLVEKIFDVSLTQPGTRIIQSSDCFVHWRDGKTGCEWGLNFTAPFDARAFRDCCMRFCLTRPGQGEQLQVLNKENIKGRFPQSFLPGKTLTADSANTVYQKKGQTTNVVANDASSNGYSLPRSSAVAIASSQRMEGSTLESSRDKQLISASAASATDAIPLYSSPRKLGLSSESRRSTCCSQNAQPLQVRQVVSVYLDNGCRCGATRCVPVTRASDPYGSHSLPYATTLQEADSSRVSQCSFQSQRGRDVVYGTMNMAMFERRVCPRHACHKHCHATTDYDNSINQTIYMASKESRRRTAVERTNPALEWKDECKIDGCKEAIGNARPSSVAMRGYLLQDQSVAGQQTGIPKDSTSKGGGDRQTEVEGMVGDSGGDVWQKRKSVVSMDWPPPPPPESPGTVSPVRNLSRNSATLPNRGDASTSSNDTKLESKKIDRINTSQEEQKTRQRLSLSTTCETSATTTTHSANRDPISRCEETALNRNVTCPSLSNVGSADVVTSKAAWITPNDIISDTLRSERVVQMEIVRDATQPTEKAIGVDSQEIEAATDDQSSNGHSSDGAATQSQKEEATSSLSGPEKQQSNDLKRDSGSWPESAEVRRLMTSDVSGSEGGSDAEEGYDCSSLHTMPSQASFASKSTVVRRAGWLTVKNWLVRRKRKIELASKRTWKKYWVCLKGNILLFYVADDGIPLTDNASPRHKLVVEGGLAQPAPEHPKKENAFSLSTAFGDAYLFQAASQVDLDNWISAIHSACAASLARQHGRDNTLRLLGGEIRRLETSIDLDIKMKKMALMHLATVSDSRSRQAIERQLNQWDENLEKFYIDHYRLRCYSASLQGAELPNPKLVLGSVSKSTKVFLSRIGAFTVSAFHAYVYARSFSPGTSTSIVAPSASSHPQSTFKTETLNTAIGPRMQSSRMLSLPPNQKNRLSAEMKRGDDLLPPDQLTKSLLRVKLPNSQVETSIQVTPMTTIQELVEAVCNKYRLNTKDHFIRLILPGSAGIKVPDKNALLCSEEFENIELRPKLIHQLELVRSAGDFGFQVEAELAEDAEEEDELCLFVSDVAVGRIAAAKGVFVGDEILVINGKVVSELDMVYIENLLLECNAICMTLRSCHIDRNQMIFDQKLSNLSSGIETLMCPPPPTQTPITDQNIGDLIVPAPNLDNYKEIPDLLRTRIRPTSDGGMGSEQIDDLLKGVNQVMHLCRRQYSLRGSSENPNNGNSATLQSSPRPLSNSQRICKVVLELIDTERFYVRDLTCLIERYLEPLKDETYISSDDIEQLFGNIQEIVQFQRLFLHSLEDAVRSDRNFNCYDDNSHLTDEGLGRVLMLIGNSFLYYAHHFKLYSSFCASHSKAQKMILSDDNAALREFLRARNPKQQHSAALESYLIKPIQRILKYPLLLKQLHELTDPRSDENTLLKDALRAMESVAEHINEMQKIYEEYGGDFEELVRVEKQERLSYKNISLSVGQLQMYGTVNWINATDEVVKPRKGCDLLTLIFIFKSAVVILAQERLRAKKRPAKAVGEPTRFKIVIPIGELQVRSVIGDPSDCRGVWEIVYCRSEKEGRPKKTYQFISSLKARNDFIRTLHRTMHEKYDTARRVSATGQPGQTVQSPRCAQHQQLKLSNATQSVETGQKLRNQTTSKAGQPSPSPSRTQNGTLAGSISSTSPTRGNSSATIQPLKNNFNPSTSPSHVNRNPTDRNPYTMDGNPYLLQNDKKTPLERQDVQLQHRGEDLSRRQAEKLDSRQSSAQMPDKTREP